MKNNVVSIKEDVLTRYADYHELPNNLTYEEMEVHEQEHQHRQFEHKRRPRRSVDSLETARYVLVNPHDFSVEALNDALLLIQTQRDVTDDLRALASPVRLANVETFFPINQTEIEEKRDELLYAYEHGATMTEVLGEWHDWGTARREYGLKQIEDSPHAFTLVAIQNYLNHLTGSRLNLSEHYDAKILGKHLSNKRLEQLVLMLSAGILLVSGLFAGLCVKYRKVQFCSFLFYNLFSDLCLQFLLSDYSLKGCSIHDDHGSLFGFSPRKLVLRLWDHIFTRPNKYELRSKIATEFC